MLRDLKNSASFLICASLLTTPGRFRSGLNGKESAERAASRLSTLQGQGLALLVKENRDAIVAAINADYGSRSDSETPFGLGDQTVKRAWAHHGG